MPPLSILIWLPAACGVLGASRCTLRGRARAAEPDATQTNATQTDATRTGGAEGARSAGVEATSPAAPDAHGGPRTTPGGRARIGSLGALGLAIGYIADYAPGTTGLTHVTDVVWISEL